MQRAETVAQDTTFGICHTRRSIQKMRFSESEVLRKELFASRESPATRNNGWKWFCDQTPAPQTPVFARSCRLFCIEKFTVNVKIGWWFALKICSSPVQQMPKFLDIKEYSWMDISQKIAFKYRWYSHTRIPYLFALPLCSNNFHECLQIAVEQLNGY